MSGGGQRRLHATCLGDDLVAIGASKDRRLESSIEKRNRQPGKQLQMSADGRAHKREHRVHRLLSTASKGTGASR